MNEESGANRKSSSARCHEVRRKSFRPLCRATAATGINMRGRFRATPHWRGLSRCTNAATPTPHRRHLSRCTQAAPLQAAHAAPLQAAHAAPLQAAHAAPLQIGAPAHAGGRSGVSRTAADDAGGSALGFRQALAGAGGGISHLPASPTAAAPAAQAIAAIHSGARPACRASPL